MRSWTCDAPESGGAGLGVEGEQVPVEPGGLEPRVWAQTVRMADSDFWLWDSFWMQGPYDGRFFWGVEEPKQFV